jgi:hypothetical protein
MGRRAEAHTRTEHDRDHTEFVGNLSTLHGGGVYGRATFVASTFANNVAAGSGNGLFASAGDPMTLRNGEFDRSSMTTQVSTTRRWSQLVGGPRCRLQAWLLRG